MLYFLVSVFLLVMGLEFWVVEVFSALFLVVGGTVLG
jgi:hypothetical protein